MSEATRRLDDGERLDWLRLWRSENVGPRAFADLLSLAGGAADALERLPELARRGGLRRAVGVCSRERAERERDALEAAGGRLIALCEPDYPRALAAIADPPPLISVLGDPALLGRKAVAVVGAREASAAGGRFARGLAAELGAAGWTVVSGLARGIDTQAHLGALDTGTVAVVAGGVDIVYPPENEALYRRVAESGAAVAEQPFGARPTARHFPRRNRIVSGLAAGVAVVEATARSGSLITARLAAEQGREVFAVPGSPFDPRHRGTNALIREGAALVECAADVIQGLEGLQAHGLRAPDRFAAGDRLGWDPAAPVEEADLEDEAPLPSPADADARRRAVLEALDPAPVGVDELVRQCHLPPSEVMAAVLELELAGRAARHGNGLISAASAGE